MDEELRAFLTEQFAGLRREMDQQFAELRRELTERIDENGQRIEAVRRELGTVIEQQQDQIRLIAEGHSMLAARMDRVEQAIESMGREILSAVKLSFAEVDRRIMRLEALVVDLEARVRRLEGKP